MRLWRHAGPRQLHFTYDDALLLRCAGDLSDADVERVTSRLHRMARYTRHAGAVVVVNAPAGIEVIKGLARTLRLGPPRFSGSDGTLQIGDGPPVHVKHWEMR